MDSELLEGGRWGRERWRYKLAQAAGDGDTSSSGSHHHPTYVFPSFVRMGPASKYACTFVSHSDNYSHHLHTFETIAVEDQKEFSAP